MNKFVVGTAIGAAIGYVIARMQERGYFEEMSNDMNEFTSKAKREVKNAVDKGANKLEYAKDRVEYTAEQGKQKVESMMH